MRTAEAVRMIAPAKVIHPPKTQGLSEIDGKVADLMAAYGNRDHHEAYRLMLETIHAIHNEHRMPSEATQAETARALGAMLGVFVSPDFEVPEVLAQEFIHFIATIGNAAYSSGLGTTDPWIMALGRQKQRAFKLSILTSARNDTKIDLDGMFNANPSLASAWFCQVWKQAFSGNLSLRVREQLMAYGEKIRPKSLKWVRDMQEPYFTCSYFGNDVMEERVKSVINYAARQVIKPVNNGKPRKRIAVVTEFWMPGHSVYRTIKGYIEAIRDDYELVLVHAIKNADEFDKSLFSEVIKLPYDGMTLNTEPLDGQGFCAVLFPDIGMTATSILLANTRMAPVQVMFTGHPVSTFGGEIDRFVLGEWTKVGLEELSYSENIVRLPGFGCIHEKPTYVPKGRTKTTDRIVINASWYGQKITPMALEALNRAVVESKRPCLVRLFAGGAATNHGAFPAVLRDIAELMPNVETEVVPHMPYDAYMGVLEEGDLAVDVFPFAGSNTVSDNLWLRKPIVCLEGDRWYNRIGPAMLRRIGIESPTTVEGYVARVAHLISDDASRQELADHIAAADLDSAIYCRDGASEFREWMGKQVNADCEI